MSKKQTAHDDDMPARIDFSKGVRGKFDSLLDSSQNTADTLHKHFSARLKHTVDQSGAGSKARRTGGRVGHKLGTHDQAITGILDAIRELMRPPEPTKKQPIGFLTNKQK